MAMAWIRSGFHGCLLMNCPGSIFAGQTIIDGRSLRRIYSFKQQQLARRVWRIFRSLRIPMPVGLGLIRLTITSADQLIAGWDQGVTQLANPLLRSGPRLPRGPGANLNHK